MPILLRTILAENDSGFSNAMAARRDPELILSYPGVDPDGADRPDNPDALGRDAIAHFRAFPDANRESPEAASAWREAWRLAGLPPSPIHFACTD